MKLIQWIIRILIALVFCAIPTIVLIFLLRKVSEWYIVVLYLIFYTYVYVTVSSYTEDKILKPFDKWFESKLK
jgi:hypothetical protein